MKTANAVPADRPLTKVYRGDALRAAAMPLGGIGTGTIALAGDGSLRQWQIQNQVNHAACVPHSFFAVWSRTVHPAGTPPAARVLQSAAFHKTEGPAAPPTSNDHVVPEAHRALLARLPGVATTELVGRYPIAELTYRDPALPVHVSMEAFSPFAPLDADVSGIPAIVFNVTVANPTADERLVSVAATLQNTVGWDTATPITGVRCVRYGGNYNTVARLDGLTAVNMTSGRLPEDDAAWGTLVLGVLDPEATCLAQWNDLDAFWDDFRTDGRLAGAADSSASPAGRTWNGALAAQFALKPGASATRTFLVAWHFPNRYVNWHQSGLDASQARSRFWLGNAYNRRFRSALDVAQHVTRDIERLTGLTRLARDTFYATTLPYALIDAVTSQMSILRSPTCFLDEEGRFFGFEGCCGASTGWAGSTGGCCPMNCTHVWNYEMALARLFPALERTMRDTEWNVQQHPSGYLPHRVTLPFYLPRLWDRAIGGPEHPAIDGLLGGILKTCREYRASGDAGWLARVWPSVAKALRYVWTAHDPDRTGVITGEQPNTYDISIYGANTFIGTLYLAALRAVEGMARLQGDADLAAECRRVAERGSRALDEQLFRGGYYVQDVDLRAHPEQNFATGCHSDHLLGQWWAHALDLGYVLDPDHVRAAARSIVRHNFRRHFRGVKQWPRQFAVPEDQGLLMCTWPRGGRPKVPTLYSDEVWTGIEYEVAALLLFEGEVGPALRLVEAVRRRYDGRKQNPWNDIECGDHYARAMSSWALLEAASGYRYDAGAADVAFAPVVGPDDFRAPFVARNGWGTFAQRARARRLDAHLSVAHGSLEVKTLRLRPRGKVRSVKVALDGRPVKARWSMAGRDCAIVPARRLTVGEGKTLRVTLA
jgi:uncharacterized protein (DUF608 family)